MRRELALRRGARAQDPRRREGAPRRRTSSSSPAPRRSSRAGAWRRRCGAPAPTPRRAPTWSSSTRRAKTAAEVHRVHAAVGPADAAGGGPDHLPGGDRRRAGGRRLQARHLRQPRAARAPSRRCRRPSPPSRRERRLDALEAHIVPLEEVYRLVGVAEIEANEADFLPRESPRSAPSSSPRVRAGAAAAHRGSAQGDARHQGPDHPRAADRGPARLRRAGRRGGARLQEGGRSTSPASATSTTTAYEETGELASLFAAAPELTGRVLFLYGDILFERVGPREAPPGRGRRRGGRGSRVRRSARPPASAHRAARSGGDRDAPAAGLRVAGRGGAHPRHRRRPGRARARTASSSAWRCSPRAARSVLRGACDAARAARRRRFHEADSVRAAAFTDLLQELVDRGERVAAVDVHKGWMEVDTFEDYRRAWAEVKRMSAMSISGTDFVAIAERRGLRLLRRRAVLARRCRSSPSSRRPRHAYVRRRARTPRSASRRAPGWPAARRS